MTADPIVQAQHDETGRMWTGLRSQIPARYFEVASTRPPADHKFEFRDDPVAIDAIGQRNRSVGIVAFIEMHDSMRSAAREIERLRAEVTRLQEYEWKYKELCK